MVDQASGPKELKEALHIQTTSVEECFNRYADDQNYMYLAAWSIALKILEGKMYSRLPVHVSLMCIGCKCHFFLTCLTFSRDFSQNVGKLFYKLKLVTEIFSSQNVGKLFYELKLVTEIFSSHSKLNTEYYIDIELHPCLSPKLT